MSTWPYTPNTSGVDAPTLFPSTPAAFLFDATPLKSFDGDWRTNESADVAFVPDELDDPTYAPPGDWLAYSSEFPSSPSDQDQVSGDATIAGWNEGQSSTDASAGEGDEEMRQSGNWDTTLARNALPILQTKPPAKLPSITQQTRAVQKAHTKHTHTPTPARSQQQLPPIIGKHHSHAPVAQKACIPCRKLKASCDDQRPCSRCVKFCRECTDRSEEEVAAAKARRKRRSVQHEQPSKPRTSKKRNATKATKLPAVISSQSSSAGSSPSQLASVIPPQAALAETDRLSIQLWSRCLLTVLQEIDLRSVILSIHSQLDVLPLQLSTLVHWHTQVTMLLMHVGDMMVPEDFTAFLTHTFTSAQLDSPWFQHSPLAPWIRMSTRPLHYAVQPTNFTTEEREQRFIFPGVLAWFFGHQTPSSVVSRSVTSDSDGAPSANEMDLGLGFPTNNPANDASPSARHIHPNHVPPPLDAPQLKVEWLPASNLAYQRWQAWLANKLIYDRQVRANRTAYSAAAAGLGLDRTTTGVFAPEIPDNLETISLAATLDRADLRVQLGEALRNAPIRVPDPDQTVEELAAGLTCLDIGKSLAAPPPLEGPYDAVTTTHASWCPAGQDSDVWRTEPVEEARKKKRLEGMDSVHHQPGRAEMTQSPPTHSRASSSGSGAFADSTKDSVHSAPACLCELSTPLPARILVNRAFERETGWRQADVERGYAMEGQRWLRHLYPASSWPIFLREQVTHWKTMLEYMGLMSVHAATAAFRVATGDATPMGPLPIPPPAANDFEPNFYTQLLTRNKEIKQVSTRKCVHVRHTDGRTEGSAYVLVWEMRDDVEDTNN